jgi:putative membrane protein
MWPVRIHGGMFHGGMGIEGAIICGIVLVLVILLVLFIIRAIRGPGRRWLVQKPDALDIAKERLAKGEISSEQFQEIKKNLS